MPSLRSFALAGGIAAILTSVDVHAEIPALSTVKDRRYVMRSAFGLTDKMFEAEGANGVWSWQPDTNTWMRLWPLVYGQAANGDGAGLTAKEDVIVVQGTTFLEFDAATNRLLRRSPALAPRFAGWGFQGAFVTATQGQQLGIPSGYYGFAFCPSSSAIDGARCGPTDFPGRPAARADLTNLLYRRDEEGTLALQAELATGPFFHLAPEHRRLTLDEARARFWTRHAYPTNGGFENSFGYLPITEGQIGPEVALDSFNAGPSNAVPLMLSYDRVTDSLLTSWRSETEPFHTTLRPAGGGVERRIFSAANPVWGLPLAVTTLSSGLPAVFEQVLPVIGRGPGAHETYWRSDVWLYNPAGIPTTVRIRRVGNPSIMRDINLPAHGAAELTDALGTLGGGPREEGGDGITNDGLIITSPYQWGAQVSVYSRTYTTHPSGRGTYGQAVPAVPSQKGYSTHTHNADRAVDTWAEAPEFFLDLRVAGQYRHNLGAVNDDDEPLIIDLYYGVATTPAPGQAPTASVTVAPHTVANINLEALLRPETRPLEPTIVKIAGSRPAPVWLAMVDNRTGDGTFVPFATFGLMGAVESTVAIPQVANTPGAQGTFWRSDLYGFFHPPAAEFDQLPKVAFYPNDPSRCGANRIDTTLIGPSGLAGVTANSPNASIARRVFPDVVAQLPDCTEGTMGALELNLGSWMAGFTRTYTTQADGGTYGDILPFYPSGGWPVQHFSGIKSSADFRINLGLYNGLEYSVVHRLLVYDTAGVEVRSQEFTVAPRRSVQGPLASFVGELPHGLYSLTVLPLDEEGQPGRSWAYVAIVDNATGDTTNLW